jgi:hypothetical protein
MQTHLELFMIRMTLVASFISFLLPLTWGDSSQALSPDSRAEKIVQQLRELPTPLPPMARSNDPVENRRARLYAQLWKLGVDAMPALSRGLEDQDVRLRRNVALVLSVLAGGWYDRSKPPVDIRGCLPALILALEDTDTRVRAWAAQDIGYIGADAAAAVPSLIRMLTRSDEASRNSACFALGGIGPPAKAALPALRKALSDTSMDVRGFARRAIEKIQRVTPPPTLE